MKTFNRNLLVALSVGAVLGFSQASYAFHDGGVAYCEGCHTMHNSSGNVAMNKKVATLTGVQYLLQGSDQSSTCLNCHAQPDAAPTGYHIMTFPVPAAGLPPVEMTPGGDFAYLGKTYTSLIPRVQVSIAERHGHNIIAADFGLVADATLLTAPGGTYANTQLSCISCHDPHSNARIVDVAGTIKHAVLGTKTLPISQSGSYGGQATATEATGVYRLLGGAGYVPDSYTAGPKFVADPPIAVAPATYNRSEAVTDTRVAYGQGMSEWCSNCHTAIHNDSTASKSIHPASNAAKLSVSANIAGATTTIATIYNDYKSSGDLSGTSATSYTSLVPYEEGVATTGTLAVNAAGALTGPTAGTENVMCLTCHRAHASAFDSSTRWNNRSEFLTVAGVYPGIDSAVAEAKAGSPSHGLTTAEYTSAMYGRPATVYATYQRSLCNKCHAKD